MEDLLCGFQDIEENTYSNNAIGRASNYYIIRIPFSSAREGDTKDLLHSIGASNARVNSGQAISIDGPNV